MGYLQKTKAKLQASVDFIEIKGKGKKKYRHRVVEIEFAGVNIFEGPQYQVVIKKLEISDMDVKQRDAHCIQKGAITVYGIARSMARRAEKMQIKNSEISGKLGQLCDVGREVVEAMLPRPGKVFGIGDGAAITYLN